MPDLPEEYRFQEYRKYMYNLETGSSTEVENVDGEKELMASSEGWIKGLLRDNGIETCPAQDPNQVFRPNIMPGFTRATHGVQGRSGGPSPQVAPAGAGAGDAPTGRRARD